MALMGPKLLKLSLTNIPTFLHWYSVKTRNANTTGEAIVDYVGSRDGCKNVGSFHIDNARPFKRALKRLLIPARKAVPYTPTSNSRMESKMYLVGNIFFYFFSGVDYRHRSGCLRGGLHVWPTT